MILDLIFIVFVLIVAFLSAKKGLFGVVSGLLSTFIAFAVAAAFGGNVKEALSKTEFYQKFLENMSAKIALKLSTGESNSVTKPFLEKITGSIADSAAATFAGIIVSFLVFVLVYIGVKLIIRLLNNIFKLPILRSANKLGGFAWGIVEALIITYIAIGVIGGLSLLNDTGFLAQQLQSSFIIKAMYENNVIIKLFT